MKNSKEQAIPGVIIDNKMIFKNHIKIYARKPHKNRSRVSKHLNHSQKRLVLSSIVKSQFSYCPLVWIFCSRTSNNMINKLHERELRVILNDHESDFETLLQNNNDVCNHHRNLQTLSIEIFKIKKGSAPPIIGSILKGRKNTYNQPRPKSNLKK